MLIQDIIGVGSGLNTDHTNILKTECSQFLRETGKKPLLKALPKDYNNFHRVKIRQRKQTDDLSEAFNKAFEQTFSNIKQRAIFAYSNPMQLAEDTDLFFIFPINGYQHMFNPEVSNSTNDYKVIVDTLVEQSDDIEEALSLVSDLAKLTYVSTSLVEAIKNNAEVILYGIPYYYAVRVNACNNYNTLIGQ
jgi:hypothetical protein